jgi:hypothetical protein
MPGRPAPGPARTADVVTSVYVWGPVRDEANRLALRVAKGLDPRFAWVEVTDSGAGTASANAAEREVVAPVRAFAPLPGVSAGRMRKVVRQNGEREAVQELQNFLRMSEPIQQAIGQLLERDVPRVLAVANLDRLQEFFCAEEAGPHPFLAWLKARQITLVASSAGGPLREGVHFDYLATQPGATRAAVRPPVVAICQRGDPDPSFLQQIFRPHEVVCLSGLSPSAQPSAVPAPRLTRS